MAPVRGIRFSCFRTFSRALPVGPISLTSYNIPR